MVGAFRGKVGTWVIGGIIGFIAFVFVIEGVFGPKSTRGLHEGSVAGTVNGEPIAIGDFNRAYERSAEMYKSLLGGKLAPEQEAGLKANAFRELVQAKLMSQAAKSSGIVVSDEQIRQAIVKQPYFLKDGKFDPALYRNVLEANHYQPSTYEKLIRDDLLVQEWTQSLTQAIKVSDQEAKEEYLLSRNTRSLKYVSLPKDEKKDGKSASEALAKAASLLKADPKSDAALNAALKPWGAEVRSTGAVSEQSGFIPGLPDDQKLYQEIFSANPPSGVKTLESQGRLIAYLVTEAKKPDLAEFEKERSQFLSQVRYRKERAVMEQILQKLREKAKLDTNADVVGEMPKMPGQT